MQQEWYMIGAEHGATTPLFGVAFRACSDEQGIPSDAEALALV